MTTPGDEALADWSLLQSVTTRLTAADTMTATLQALMLPAPAADQAEACLWTIDSDAHGTPEWLTMVGILPTLVMALPLRGRIVGLWTVHWSRQLALGPSRP